MHKKAAAASQAASLKEYQAKIGERLNRGLEDVESLLKQTSLPNYPVPSQPEVLNNLLKECEDSAFWFNFKKAAPILFCMSVEAEQ
jgi:hypothetical protein